MIFRTAGFQPAQDHEAGWKPAVQKHEKTCLAFGQPITTFSSIT